MTSKSSILSEEISPKDDMFTGSLDHYFSAGSSALACILDGLAIVGKETQQVKKILDLPCGYGRVLRHFCTVFPDAEITACDLSREGVDFCADAFKARPVYSHVDASKISIEGTFDLIWVGSLFTHLDRHQRREFLQFFSKILDPEGLLVVTLHGEAVKRNLTTGQFVYGLDEVQQNSLLEQYQTRQSGYVDYHHSSGYGISIATPEIYRKEIAEVRNLNLCLYKESAWDHHHDVAYLEAVTRTVYRSGAFTGCR